MKGISNDLNGFYNSFNQANHTNIGNSSNICICPDYVEQVPTTLDQLSTWEKEGGETYMVNGNYAWDGTASHHE